MSSGIIKSYKSNINSFRVIIGGKKIEIKHQYQKVYNQCKDYMADFARPEYVIPYSPEFAVKISNIIDKPEFNIRLKKVAVTLDPAVLEAWSICFLIAHKMLEVDTLLMHGAVVALDNKAYIFIASSGTGKTTHILNWKKIFPETVIINGDKPLINTSNRLVYGTPWCGKEGYNTNTSAPLAGIISLERGKDNSIKPISFHEMLPILLQQTYIPMERVLALKAYSLIGNLKDVHCYKLMCNMKEESALVAYEGIKANEISAFNTRI